MPVLPLAQLGYLFVRTVAKPVATTIKNRMKKHPSFKKGCVQMAQAYHRWERRMKVHLMGIKLANVQPLSEEKAIELGANMLSETILFSVAGALIYVDFARRSAKDKEKESSKLEILLTLQRELDTLRQSLLLMEHEQQKFREHIEQQFDSSSSSGKWINWNFLSKKSTPSSLSQQEHYDPSQMMMIKSTIIPPNSFLSNTPLSSIITPMKVTTTIIDNHNHYHDDTNDKWLSNPITIQSILTSSTGSFAITPFTTITSSNLLLLYRSMLDRISISNRGKIQSIIDSLLLSLSSPTAGIGGLPPVTELITPTLTPNSPSSLLLTSHPNRISPSPESRITPTTTTTTTTPSVVVDHLPPSHERPWYYRPFKWFLSTLDDIWDDLSGDDNGNHEDDNNDFSTDTDDSSSSISSNDIDDI